MDNLTFFLSVASISVAAGSFAVAVTALVFAFRGDRRKSGMDVRCDFRVTESIASSEPWVSEIRLQNEKDRAVTIYKIYLEIGHGVYIEVEDFSKEPLTLEPHGSYRQEYDPVEFYSVNMRQFKGAFAAREVRQRLVLATTQGRHFPKRGLNLEDPMLDTIGKNLYGGAVRPVRLWHKGRSYGSEMRYVVTFFGVNGSEEVVPIHPKDYERKKFREFSLTREALETKQQLEQLLQYEVDNGNLKCKGFEVLDIRPPRQELVKEYQGSMEFEPNGWFAYNVIGRILTKWEYFKLRHRNRFNRA